MTAFRSGDDIRADQLLAEAEVGYRTLRVAGEPGLTQVLINRAVLARRRGDPAAALSQLQSALEVAERRFGDEHVRVGAILVEQARTSAMLANPTAAAKHWQRALQILLHNDVPARSLAETFVEAAPSLRDTELAQQVLEQLQVTLAVDDEVLLRAQAAWPPR